MTLTSCKPVTFVGTRDRAKATAFYGGTLGLAQVAEDPFAVTYDLAGTPLRLTDIGTRCWAGSSPTLPQRPPNCASAG